MANRNQQVTHIYDLEQYEANKIQIAKMKEWLRTYESQNEIGFEGFKVLQEDLERRIREGEEARSVTVSFSVSACSNLIRRSRQRLQALQQRSSLQFVASSFVPSLHYNEVFAGPTHP
jgi:hypothetical protein